MEQVSPPMILIVDDEPTVRSMLTEVLSREPYTVLSAGTAAEALESMGRQAVDVVISDEMMPGMTGSEFLAAVRRSFPGTMRIMLTGHAMRDSTIRAIHEGVIFRCLTKPCQVVQLLETVRAALDARPPAPQRTEPSLDQDPVADDDLSLEDLERRHPGITQVKRDKKGHILIE